MSSPESAPAGKQRLPEDQWRIWANEKVRGLKKIGIGIGVIESALRVFDELTGDPWKEYEESESKKGIPWFGDIKIRKRVGESDVQYFASVLEWASYYRSLTRVVLSFIHELEEQYDCSRSPQSEQIPTMRSLAEERLKRLLELENEVRLRKQRSPKAFESAVPSGEFLMSNERDPLWVVTQGREERENRLFGV